MRSPRMKICMLGNAVHCEQVRVVERTPFGGVETPQVFVVFWLTLCRVIDRPLYLFVTSICHRRIVYRASVPR